MMLCVLTSALLAGLCHALNVTVSPSPWTFHPVGGNASITCSVSQKRKHDSLLTVRWTFSSGVGHEQTIGRITKYGNIHMSGNWSQRGELSSEIPGQIYRLLLTFLHPSDQGHYSCRVQEVAQHRNRWSAVSNGTASTCLKVNSLTIPEERPLFSWTSFQDLYLYAVLLCCIGVLSILTFFLVLLCQTISKRRKVKWKGSHERPFDKYHSVTDQMPPIPIPKKKKQKRKIEEEVPPVVPIKGPLMIRGKTLQEPLLLPRLVEDGLAYAELELVKPTPSVKDSTSSTIYAKILFKENAFTGNTDIAGQKSIAV